MIVQQTLRAQERQTESTEMVFADASDRMQHRLERGAGLREDFLGLAVVNGDRECVASWLCLRRLSVGIQFADECVSILLRSGGKLSDERFDEVTAGIFKRGGTTEIRGIRLYKRRIEIVLTD